MSGFAPSLEAARSALGAATPIDTRPHPSGAAGAKISLEEVAARVRKGRLDPRVRAWAIRSVKEAGEPRTPAGQAQAILDALRKVTTYVQDPVNAEFMQAAQETLCLDDKGLCFKGGDCDDLVIAYGSATSSIGLPTKVVGQSFAMDGVPTHVIAAVQDTKSGKWYRVDPSSKYDVGSYFPATKEVWLDPMTGSVDGEVGMGGEFVGVGQPPSDGTLGASMYVPSLHGNDVQELLAPYYWAHGFAGGPQTVGVGDYTGDQRKAIFDSATSSLQGALFKLQSSLIDLRTSKDNANRTRAALNPNNPFDPEPANPIIDVSDFLTGGAWTLSMSNVCDSLISLGETLVKAGQDALNGTRRILVDDATQNAYLEATDQDPWRLHAVSQTSTDTVLAFLEKPEAISPALLAAATVALAPVLLPLAIVAYTFTDGFTYLFSYNDQQIDIRRIVGGFSSKTGQTLTPQDVQAQINAQQQGSLQGRGLGALPIIVIVGIAAVGLAIVSVAAYFIVAKLCDTAVASAKEATNQAVLALVASNKLTPDQATEILQVNSDNRVAEAKAEAEKSKADPFSGALESLGKIVTWLVIGGVVVTGVVIGAPLIKEGVNELTAWSKDRRERLRAERQGPAPALPPGPSPETVPATAEAFANPRRRVRRRRRA